MKLILFVLFFNFLNVNSFITPSINNLSILPKNKALIKYNDKIDKFQRENYKIIQNNSIVLKLSLNDIDLPTITPQIIKFVSLFSVYIFVGYLFMMFQRNNMKNPFGKEDNNRVDLKLLNKKFEDVAGIDYLKPEIYDIIEYLKNPKPYKDIGAKIPTGILFSGLPGSGKTLLAQVIANEANVSFFSINGSNFVQLFVGVGAMRVRELFEKARKSAPSIIFIDEIDSIGIKRSTGFGSNNQEQESTLTELLNQMDGFSSKLNDKPVIVLASTNRVDILDDALTRPGRFDKKIHFKNPDNLGRIDILKVHSKNKNIANNIDYDTIAKQTVGFSGAELANVMNEAALLAVRSKSEIIENIHIDNAIDKHLMGISLSTTNTVEHDKIVSIHEISHALTAILLNHNKVTRISIVPTSHGISGFTLILPDEKYIDSGLISKKYLLNEIKTLLGGRIGEELFFGNENITTGASSDLERAKQIATQMLDDFAMDDQNEELFGYNYEDRIHLILKKCYDETFNLLKNNKKLIELLNENLLEKKVLFEEDIIKLINKKNII